jgi:chromosome segregation ATPase
MAAAKLKLGFRFVPWRWSWKTFGLVFLAFLAVNYAVVRYASRQPLFSEQRDDVDRSIRSVQAALSDQNQDLLTLRGEIEEIRITSESQRRTIQEMQKNLDAAGGRLSWASKEVARLLTEDDHISGAADREEQTLDKITTDLADVKARLQRVRDTLAQSGSKP